MTVKTSISLPKSVKRGEAINLTFKIENLTNEPFRFCIWATPFESVFLNNYMRIKDANGDEVSYIGAMAKRMMPPPESTYTSINPKSSRSATVDLSKSYDFSKKGKYTIQFNGMGSINDLPNSNVVSIIVE